MKNIKLILAFMFIFFMNSISYSYSIKDLDTETQYILSLSQIKEKNLSSNELQKLEKTAKSRLRFIQAHLDNPSIFKKFLLPKKIMINFPNQLQPYLEKEITSVEGTLEVLATIETNNKKEAMQYILRQNNKVYRLHFIDQPPKNFVTDSKIKINQAWEIPTSTRSHHLIVSANDIVILKSVKALPLSFGPQSTYVFLVNFSDEPADRPWTKDYMNTLVFTTTNNFYKEASYNQTSIVGETKDWIVVNVSSTADCDTIIDDLPTLANQAATDAGVDLSQYPRRVYFFPKTSSCTWSGLGTVGGQVTRALINGSASSFKTVAHELGHNVGLYHAQALRCTSSPIEGDCTVSEYGDGTDTMGNISGGHFNAFQKDRLGWLNYQESPPITTVTQSGSYFIDAYETANKRAKALKVLKRAGGDDYYYLELRQGIGFDKELEDCGAGCDYTRGIVFHQGNPSVGSPSQLLDMSPGEDNEKVALLPCQSWTDADAPNGGVTFAVQSISKDGARVKVTFGGVQSQCHHHVPLVKIFSNYTKWLAFGEEASYEIEIKNTDSSTCKSRQFSLMFPNNKDHYFTSALQENTFALNPGVTKVVKFTVKSHYAGSAFLQPLELTLKDNTNANATVIPLTLGLTKA